MPPRTTVRTAVRGRRYRIDCVVTCNDTAIAQKANGLSFALDQYRDRMRACRTVGVAVPNRTFVRIPLGSARGFAAMAISRWAIGSEPRTRSSSWKRFIDGVGRR